jgi:polysaccharide chain length determinant protein (PEP-CTERM system associated)
MEEQSGAFPIDHYVELAFKHRWLLVVPFCLALAVGIVLAFVLPKMYEASTLIFVRPQKVPSSYVQSLVTEDLNTRINTISQQILSRTNLEKVINQFNLFKGPGQEDVFMEDKVENLRSRISIDLQATGRRKEADAFSISFTGPDPELITRVVNGLAALFIDENLRVREAQASGTSEFLEQQLETMRQRLETVEQKLREYRKNHRGELPEQLESNLRALDRLQMQLNERQESLRNAKDRLVILDNQIKASRDLMRQGETVTVTEESGEAVTLAQMKQQLVQLQTVYTDRHPDVIRLKGRIAEMEAKMNSGEIGDTGSAGAQPSGSSSNTYAANLYNEQARQRTELNLEIRNLNSDIAKINSEIQAYQRRVENTPKREEELLTFQRDYQNIQESYNSLLNRQLEAQIAVNMEKKQKGEQFQVIDRAQVPRNPASPDMKKLFLITIAVGLGLGGGLIFLVDYFDSSFKRSEDIEKALGISVLATIPKVYQTKDFRRRKLRKVMTVCSLLVTAGLLGSFAAVVFIGPEATLKMVQEVLSFQIA